MSFPFIKLSYTTTVQFLTSVTNKLNSMMYRSRQCSRNITLLGSSSRYKQFFHYMLKVISLPPYYMILSSFYNSFYFSILKFKPIIFLMHQVPVVDGYSYPHLTKRMNVAGRHITSYLVDLLSRRG